MSNGLTLGDEGSLWFSLKVQDIESMGEEMEGGWEHYCSNQEAEGNEHCFLQNFHHFIQLKTPGQGLSHLYS